MIIRIIGGDSPNGEEIRSSEITPESVYVNRRSFLGLGAASALGVALLPGALAACGEKKPELSSNAADAEPQGGDTPTPYQDVTTYNNYYEFGTDKSDPAQNAKTLRTHPWTVSVEGLVKKPASYSLEDFIKPSKIEDRTYRHRCVEAWSMVIPWRGFPLRDVI